MDYNLIEEYNEAYRRLLIDRWQPEVELCQNWLDGHRSYFKVGYLANISSITEDVVKSKLEYANKILNNIDYYVQRHSYGYKKPNKQKDNDLSFVGVGEGWAYSSKIRVPKLKRKTAWKRFYKMFPGLKGKKIITGSSSCFARSSNGNVEQQIQHKSMIKLKKIKKK